MPTAAVAAAAAAAAAAEAAEAAGLGIFVVSDVDAGA